jgi:hypothetical protein
MVVGPMAGLLIGVLGVLGVVAVALLGGGAAIPALEERHTIDGWFVLANPPGLSSIDAASCSLGIGTRCPNADGGRDRCYGAAGYADIEDGKQIIVLDGDGKVLGVGTLGESSMPDVAQGSLALGDCVFRFHVRDVPKAAFYVIDGGNKGEADLHVR